MKLEMRRIESVFGCGPLFVSKYTVKVTALLILYLIVGKLLVTMDGAAVERDAAMGWGGGRSRLDGP